MWREGEKKSINRCNSPVVHRSSRAACGAEIRRRLNYTVLAPRPISAEERKIGGAREGKKKCKQRIYPAGESGNFAIRPRQGS